MNNQLVLIVDDTKVYRLGAYRSFTNEGFEVVTAVNGSEAVEYIKNSTRKPSLILMDQSMPEMDGIEATQLIKQVDPDIPIFGFTTETNETTLRDFKNAGLSGFYNKPIKTEEIKEIKRKFST